MSVQKERTTGKKEEIEKYVKLIRPVNIPKEYEYIILSDGLSLYELLKKYSLTHYYLSEDDPIQAFIDDLSKALEYILDIPRECIGFNNNVLIVNCVDPIIFDFHEDEFEKLTSILNLEYYIDKELDGSLTVYISLLNFPDNLYIADGLTPPSEIIKKQIMEAMKKAEKNKKRRKKQERKGMVEEKIID